MSNFLMHYQLRHYSTVYLFFMFRSPFSRTGSPRSGMMMMCVCVCVCVCVCIVGDVGEVGASGGLWSCRMLSGRASFVRLSAMRGTRSLAISSKVKKVGGGDGVLESGTVT